MLVLGLAPAGRLSAQGPASGPAILAQAAPIGPRSYYTETGVVILLTAAALFAVGRSSRRG